MSPGRIRDVDLLVTDLDNTLYDWSGFFVPSFLAMLAEIERISGLPREELRRSFRRVYQEHRTTEYAFAIQELDVLRETEPDMSPTVLLRKYDPAIHAFRSTRKGALRLYPGVREALLALKDAGVVVVGHSDSMMEYVSRRLRQLGIDELVAAIAAPEDHGLPTGVDPGLIRRSPNAVVRARTRELAYSPALRKPDPHTLDGVFETFAVSRDRVLYVGDSLSRDVLLARRSGVKGVWARYGATRHPELYRELLAITYWTDQDVAEEERLTWEASLGPPLAVIDRFAEILRFCLR